MEAVFISLLNTAIMAGYLVIAVLLLRPILKKAPRGICCVLWGLVGLRLILPFSFESIFSLIPSAQTIPQEIITSPTPSIHSGFTVVNQAINPVITQTMSPTLENSITPMQVAMGIGRNIWLVGVLAMTVYALISFLLLKRKLREAVQDSGNVWLCDRVDSPFLLGLFRPRIYLPSNLAETDKDYVLAHENAHIRRKDHWWKPLGFLLLTLYWFHPLLWVGYIFLCRDIEYACDEKVIQAMGTECRKSYSQALINCSMPRKMISACPVAFGENSIKGRIKSVLNYKKPAFWIILVSLILCIAVGICFLTNPVSDKNIAGKYETGECLYSYVVSEEKETKSNDLVFDIHDSGSVFQYINTLDAEYVGTLQPSQYTATDLNAALTAQEGKKLSLGQIRSVYEVVDDSGNRVSVIFQKPSGELILISFFSDGKIMVVFRLTSAGVCEWTHTYLFTALVEEVREDSLLVSPFEGDLGGITANQIIVKVPEFSSQEFSPGELVTIRFAEGTVDNSNPPVISNPYLITSSDTYNWTATSSQYFDVDKDGIEELCTLGPGPTSGLFTFVFTAYENNIPEYCSIFNTECFQYSFRELTDGSIVVSGKTQQNEVLTYTIGMENGEIALYLQGEKASYWGVLNEHTLSDVREKYPHFLGLNTAKGLEVYVWKNKVWRCGIRSGTNRNATIEELQAFGEGATLSEMALILGSYGIKETDIAILYSYDPAFSGLNPKMPTVTEQSQITYTLFEYLRYPALYTPLYYDRTFSPTEENEIMVFCSQFAEGAWRFQIWRNISLENAFNYTSTYLCMDTLSLEETKAILAECDVPPEEIPVVLVQHTLSSYLFTKDEQTLAEARALLGLE